MSEQEKEQRSASLPVVTEEGRCSGHCCKHFTMPQSPARLWEMYDEWYAQARHDSGRLFRENNDIHIVAPMVIHLGEVTHDPLNGQPYLDGKVKHNYTCKHHDAETGNCRIYEHRPQLCRDYPNGYDCRYEGCTMPPRPSPFAELVGETLAEMKSMGSEEHEKMEAAEESCEGYMSPVEGEEEASE